MYIETKYFHNYVPELSRTYVGPSKRSSAKGSSSARNGSSKKKSKKTNGSDDGFGLTWSSSFGNSNSGAAAIPGVPEEKRKRSKTQRYVPQGSAAAASTDYSDKKYPHHTPKDCEYKVGQFLSQSRAGINLVARIHFSVSVDEINAELAEGSKLLAKAVGKKRSIFATDAQSTARKKD